MARKLALIFILIQSLQIAALPTPLTNENSIVSATVSHASTNQPPQLHQKRFFFPETLPDQDELEAILRETAMREAGFIPSSKPESEPTSNQESEPASQQKSLPNPDAKIGTAASAQPVKYKLCNQAQTFSNLAEAFRITSEEYAILWPPFGVLVIGAAIVCFGTIRRGIRAKK
ncbi:hypothetical protein N7457_001731 [Penicillium paradoxum]|uniref:uncharacterized protein n=1 Tax=Penicillium paradoxum TaxID=176176 RepID=UPI0025478FDC|nr:uncharacterized protein N7457_001731 [Penicillium paradoxum]KAJ5795132.1 hypothetical protein N7457_001731 [Penicillium paradoxum]